MFIQLSELEPFFMCNVCEQKLRDPRMLPCGRSVCNSCIDTLADTNKKKIKCQDCGKVHEIPHEGFPPNISLANILQVKSNEVFRSKAEKDLKATTNSIRVKAENLKMDLKIGDAKIRDHCDKVRNDVQIAIEQAHERLNDLHNEFMSEIDAHEQTCQENFKFIQQNKREYEAIIANSSEFLNTTERMLKLFEINENEIKNSLDGAHALLDELDKAGDKLKSDMLHKTILKFDKSLEQLEIGKIKKQ